MVSGFPKISSHGAQAFYGHKTPVASTLQRICRRLRRRLAPRSARLSARCDWFASECSKPVSTNIVTLPQPSRFRYRHG